MLKLECFDAKEGDCLLLHYGTKTKRRFVLIDGGPKGVYSGRLKKALQKLQSDPKVNPSGGPLPIELGMVSHIDADHITGILDLFNELAKENDASKHLVEFKKFWHNSLAHLLADADVASTASVQKKIVSSVEPALPVARNQADHTDGRAVEIIAGVKQGAKLATLLVKLGLQENTPFDGPARSGKKPVRLPGAFELNVVWPDSAALSNLKTDWKKQTGDAEIAAYLDKSVANLSSIVALVTCEEKTILLTGDARGDDILKGLKNAGLLEDGSLHVDVLKMPHHGSDRNMETGFLETVTADTYVFSANGKHDNPDAATLEMLRQARPGASYTVVLTNLPVMENPDKQPGFDAKLAELRADPNVTLVIRDDGSPSVVVDLA